MKICPSCGRLLPEQEYFLNADGSERSRKSVTCRACRAVQEPLREWTWASGLRKELAMSEHADLTRLSAAAITAIFAQQRGRCAISGLSLVIPDAGIIPVNGTLSKWRETLSASDRRLSPVLARISASAEWRPGSVAILAAMWLEPCRHYGSTGQLVLAARELSARPII